MSESMEIWFRGKSRVIPTVSIQGRKVLASGGWVKTAAVADEWVVEGELVAQPEEFVAALKQSKLQADLFTFSQRPLGAGPKFGGHFDWGNFAALRVTTYDAWWRNLSQETRRNIRLSAKRGLTVKVVSLDEELVRGIQKLCDEAPVRQGRPFWYYRKDIETIRRTHSTYLDRSEFIGAYLGDELVGYLKMVYADGVAHVFQILASVAHKDKKPMNALVSKAVEVCAQAGMTYFVHGQYVYGNKSECSLTEFKRRNGFERLDYPTYYIPWTWKGRIYVRLRLYRGLIGLLPGPVLGRVIAFRARLNEWWQKAGGERDGQMA